VNDEPHGLIWRTAPQYMTPDHTLYEEVTWRGVVLVERWVTERPLVESAVPPDGVRVQ
jgi:hypothetical protein